MAIKDKNKNDLTKGAGGAVEVSEEIAPATDPKLSESKTETGETPNVGDQIEIATGEFAEVVSGLEKKVILPPTKKLFPPRNIKYAGLTVIDKTGKIIRDDQPITRLSGADKIVLPSADEQKSKRIFWHDDAGKIVQMFPGLYKLVRQRKG